MARPAGAQRAENSPSSDEAGGVVPFVATPDNCHGKEGITTSGLSPGNLWRPVATVGGGGLSAIAFWRLTTANEEVRNHLSVVIPAL
ncbi:MAG: hypothetical protein J2P58_13885 [Acidimicrobiaceae bacterium]|nr:hypothetical protein [Acidimicrobiaceae bacterium]